MRRLLASFLALSVCCLAARADEALAPTLNRRDLLVAAFPAWKPARDASGRPTQAAIPSIHLPGVTWPWTDKGRRSGRHELEGVNVTAMDVIQLDATHAVLMTLVLPDAAAHEQACDSYSCTYALGSYFFERVDQGWRLSRREDVAGTLDGSAAPRMHVRAWADRGYVVDATTNDCHGGDCVERLALIGVAPNTKVFSFEATIGFDASGFGRPDPEDCERLLERGFKVPDDADYHPGDCARADGSWRVDGEALRIDVDERRRTIADDGSVEPLERTHPFARLVPDHGTLKVIEGTLPNYGL
jgi:hypothetical protein